jgi:hypothetical protein
MGQTEKSAGNRQFGYMAGPQIYSQLLFAIMLQFQPANNARQ